MVAKRPRADPELNELLSTLRAENQGLKEELNILRTPIKKTMNILEQTSDFKKMNEIPSDEFLEFDSQSVQFAYPAIERIEDQLKRFQRNLDNFGSIKNNVQMMVDKYSDKTQN
jgi:hypothetical protein